MVTVMAIALLVLGFKCMMKGLFVPATTFFITSICLSIAAI